MNCWAVDRKTSGTGVGMVVGVKSGVAQKSTSVAET